MFQPSHTNAELSTTRTILPLCVCVHVRECVCVDVREKEIACACVLCQRRSIILNYLGVALGAAVYLRI